MQKDFFSEEKKQKTFISASDSQSISADSVLPFTDKNFFFSDPGQTFAAYSGGPVGG
ncbi:MAG TPA: hypothetical protein VMB71_10050 [Acetobacteraceae bacterium]|nr:hypothetical protein [Acetobacteraceae bacterium]